MHRLAFSFTVKQPSKPTKIEIDEKLQPSALAEKIEKYSTLNRIILIWSFLSILVWSF